MNSISFGNGYGVTEADVMKSYKLFPRAIRIWRGPRHLALVVLITVKQWASLQSDIHSGTAARLSRGTHFAAGTRFHLSFYSTRSFLSLHNNASFLLLSGYFVSLYMKMAWVMNKKWYVLQVWWIVVISDIQYKGHIFWNSIPPHFSQKLILPVINWGC